MRRIALISLLAACAEPTSVDTGPLGVTPVAVDDRGAPRLLHSARAPLAPAATVTESARRHVTRIAPAYGVSADAMPELEPAGEVPVRGGAIARLRQVIDGIPVDDGELRVLVHPGGELRVASGTLVRADTPRTPFAFAPVVSDEAGAIARAVEHTHGVAFDRSVLAIRQAALRGGSDAGIDVELASTKQVWHRTGNRLVAAWVVEAYTSPIGSTASEAHRTVIDGQGRVLAHRSLTADVAFQYRVFAETTGERHPFDAPVVDPTPHATGVPNGAYPAYIGSQLVTVEGLNNKGGAPDPWLAAGASTTSGNNVAAYVDITAPDGFSNGDFFATTTAATTFNRTYNTAQDAAVSQNQRMAGITSLFFGINWLHDFWYDAGFTEAAGNAQTSNFGRGGIEGDAILAEAQDGSGRNNANMSSPSDGIPPKMQVFVWDPGDVPNVDLDGTLDSTLLAHEFGHYLHHRLQVCGTQMCGALSEGWGDFLALMLIAREGDDFTGAYPFAVYTTQSFNNDPAYFGIRRAPYSVDTSINAMSFRHMGDNAALPATHPLLRFGNNAEVHNAGEIWAAAMWEAYVALLTAPGADFTATRQRMAEYVVAGLLLAPSDGTPTETRDAILAAAFAVSPADHDRMAAAFARRGLGSCAVSPARDSVTFSGITESADVRGRALPGESTVEVTQQCDDDDVLDAGEVAKVRVPVTNPGHATVNDVSVEITSTTPGVTVVSGPAALGTLAPYTTADVEVEIALADGTTGAVDGTIALEVTASASCVPTVTRAVKVRFNVDDTPESSQTDTFDAGETLWTPTTTGEPGWDRIQETALDLAFHGADLGVIGDTTLESPMLTATGPVTVAFDHSFKFEFSGGMAFDGGVIEVRLAGGDWEDVTAFGVDPDYNSVLIGESGNPLGGRDAFSSQSPSFPAASRTTLSFGAAIAAGTSFQIRFRIGTDQALGDAGWFIDDVAFAGIVGTPFSKVDIDDGVCGPGNGDDGGGCCDAGPLRAGNGVAALGVLALVLRRRRRRNPS